MTTFEIPDGPSTVPLSGGKGRASFTVTNKSGAVREAKLSVQVTGNTRADWFTIEGERTRTFAPAESQTVTVKIAVPDGTAAGDYRFRLRGVEVNIDPDNDFADSPVAALTVASSAAQRFPWWIVVLGVTAFLAVACFLVTAFLSPGFLLPPAGPNIATNCRWSYAPGFGGQTVPLRSGPRPDSLRFGDFDGDGRTDILLQIADPQTGYRWYHSYGGTGDFLPRLAGHDLRDMDFADIDGDRRTDAFTISREIGHPILWQFSRGAADPFETLRTGPDVENWALGNFVGDGRADLFATPPAEVDGLTWMIYSGAKEGPMELNAGDVPDVSELLFGDFDGDGWTDMVFEWDNGDGTSQWRLTSLRSEVEESLGVGPLLKNMVVADPDGDGRDDLLLRTQGTNGRTEWSFAPGGMPPLQPLRTSAELGPVGDFDADGKSDLFISDCD